jgi:uncharacterized protein (DUF885 family)
MNRWSRVLLACLLSSSLFAGSLGLSACGGSPPTPGLPTPSPSAGSAAPPAPPAPAPAQPPAATAEAQLDAFFEAHDRARLARSPQGQSYRAIKTDYDKWDDPSDEAAATARAEEDAMVADLRTRFSSAPLDDARRMSYALFETNADRATAAYAFRDFGYVFDQMNGPQSGLPAFLINIHKVDTRGDLEAYVRRLEGLGPTLRKYIALAQSRAAKGVSPPRWVYPFVVSDATNVITGAPFDARPDSALFADFKTKLAALKLPEADAAALTTAARTALVDGVAPAYRELIAAMKALEKKASTDDGVWRLARGAEYYAERLRSYTTTAMTADEIHALGLQEVARIHGEMRTLMPALGFRGKDFAAFLRTMRARKDLYFSNDEAGRAQYLSATRKALDEITAKLPQWFGILPKAQMELKAVEAFREKSAGKAFYQRPAPDGSRPGTYYVNLYNMAAMPNTEVEALAYHEGVPGHHMQIAIQMELGELPPFRKFGGVTAYSEGWGLYAEKLAKEMGQYQEPLRDFGRLQLELHRAIRLVVDTGLHHKKWKKAQAIRYVMESTAEPLAAATKAIERYIVFPGQATAYMIGRLKISSLRDRAAAELGEAFDVRTFHDVVLRNGPIPLDVLEQEVTRWIASRKQG